jgi:hypothetical protein
MLGRQATQEKKVCDAIVVGSGQGCDPIAPSHHPIFVGHDFEVTREITV